MLRGDHGVSLELTYAMGTRVVNVQGSVLAVREKVATILQTALMSSRRTTGSEKVKSVFIYSGASRVERGRGRFGDFRSLSLTCWIAGLGSRWSIPPLLRLPLF